MSDMMEPLTLDALKNAAGKCLCNTRQPERITIRIGKVEVLCGSMRIYDYSGYSVTIMLSWIKDWFIFDELDLSQEGRLSSNGLVQLRKIEGTHGEVLIPVYKGVNFVPRATIDYLGLSKNYFLYDSLRGWVLECAEETAKQHGFDVNGDKVTLPVTKRYLSQLGATRKRVSHANLSYDIYAYIVKDRMAHGMPVMTDQGHGTIVSLAEPGYLMIALSNKENVRVRITDVIGQFYPQSWEELMHEKALPLDGHRKQECSAG